MLEKVLFFSRGHATLELAVSVGRKVGHIFEFRAVFALLLLPNRSRLYCRVSGLVTNRSVYFPCFESHVHLLFFFCHMESFPAFDVAPSLVASGLVCMHKVAPQKDSEISTTANKEERITSCFSFNLSFQRAPTL